MGSSKAATSAAGKRPAPTSRSSSGSRAAKGTRARSGAAAGARAGASLRAASPAALQLKVTLSDTRPPVWRRIVLAASCTFWELHLAVQDAMGWSQIHRHEFDLRDEAGAPLAVGLPSDKSGGGVCRAGWEVAVAPFLHTPGDSLSYVYDFGADWRHVIALEAIVPAAGQTLPRCSGGERACPPEGCGGPLEYQAIVEGRIDDEVRDWLGPYEPARFEPARVRFTDAHVALQALLAAAQE